MAKKKKSLADELLEEPLVKSNTTKNDTKKVSVANTPKQRVTNTFEEIAPIRKTQNNLMSRDEVLSPLNIGKQKKIIQTAMNREKPEDNSSFFGTTANVLKTFGQGMMKAEESIFIDTPSALISKAILGGSRVTSRVASIFDDDLASKILIKGTQASNKLNEIAQDDWTANALDYYGWNKKLDNGKTVAETLESKSAITSNDILGKAVEGLGGMTPTILMGGLLGGSTAGVQTAQELEKVKKLQNVVSYSSLGARSFGGAYEQALQSGATPDQAMAYGISSSAVEIGTEWLSGGVPGVKGTVGGGLDEAFGKYVLKEGVEETSKSLSKAITKSLYKTSMEGVEEMISETLEPYIKQFTYEYDESKSLGENFNEASKKVSFQDIMEAGVVGSLTAVLLGDVDISDMKTGYQNTQAINNTIANEIQNQQNMLGRELTKKESNAIKTEIKDHANNVNQYGEEIANRIIDVKNNNTSTEGLDLEQSYKAYNGEKKYTKEITNIQKFMNNRNIEARFDATMFDNNEQNAIWTTQDGKDNVIFNPNASAEQVIQNIATHEMTHDIINQKTEAGTSLFNDVLENIKTQENYAEDRQEIEDLYAKYYDKNAEDFSAKVDEEMVANELGKNLGTQEYINRLVNEKPNLAKRIYNWVVDKLDNIGKSEEYKEQKAYWKSVADKFEVAYNEQKTATGEDKTAYSLEQNAKRYDDLKLTRDLEYFKKDNGDVKVYFIDSNNNLVNEISLSSEDSAVKELGKDIGEYIFKNASEDNQKYNIGNDINNTGSETDYFMTHRPTETGITADNITNQDVETPMPKDFLTHPEYYSSMNEEYTKESVDALRRIEGNPNADVTIYRATKGNSINKGDWVTLSRQYAEAHNQSQGDGKWNIVEKVVKAKDIQFAGDDINEWGYFPQTDTKYSLTKDNTGRELSEGQREYFKDSKVVDDEGNLQVVYHGSYENGFTIFDKNMRGSATNAKSSKYGFFFTDNYNLAKDYSQRSASGQLFESYLNMTNPLVKDFNGEQVNADAELTKMLKEAQSNGNDGIIAYNLKDGFRTDNQYVVFDSNQIKNVDNLNPTENEDIRYSMQQEETPFTQGTRTTMGELFENNIAPIREDLSNITEQMNNLSNQIETLQNQLETTPQGYVETYNEQRNENIPTRQLTEADANTLQDALMQDEGYLRSLDEQANQTTDNTKLVDKLTNEVNRRLDLDKGQKETLRNIINDSIEKGYSADELSYALYKEFSESSYEMTNQEAVDARRLIRDIPIKVSDSIKTDIADYGKWKQSNFGKINFSNSGSPVDSVYMELSEKMPYFFPSDIVNPTDQLLRIAEVANMATKTTETFDIDPDEFDNIADYIVNTQLEDEYNSQMNSQYDLEKNIQFDMNEDIAPTTIRTQDSIEDYIENRDIAPVKPDRTQQRAENRLKRSNAWRSFREKITNRNAVIDDYAKATGNRQIKFTGDMLNSVSGEVQYNIYNRQTDINGKTIGKSINEIFEPSKKAGLYQVFNDYLFNKSNIERHRVGKGSQVPEAVSQQLVNQYEQQYPEVKKWAKDVYKYYDNVLQEQVNAGLITQEQYNNYRGENGIYRSYTPFYTDNIDSRYFDNEGKIKPVSTLKRSKGNASDVSQLLSMEDAMAKQTYAYKRAIRQNELFKEIVSASEKYSDAMDMDVRDNPTNLNDSLYTTPEGDKVVTAYINGEKVSAKISDELFNELSGDNEARIKQFEEDFSIVTNPLQRLSGVRRNLLTTWNPTFLARNAIKDIQDAVINSKHTAGMLKNYIPGIKELSSAKTQTAQQFLALYGADNLYGDYSNISKGKKAINKFVRLNELIELAPRFAEFKASLQAGDSVQEAIYNAREVTTNFGRGGYITKALNRNGFTFLNANVQGLSKLVRNLSGENGAKGVASVVVKGALFAVAPSILNHLLYGLDDDKDEEYEAIPDYIKDNYYLVKTEGNNFVRIPKGRINAVFGSLARRMIEAGEGEGFDFKEWGENAWNQIGVGDSSGIQTIFTPLRQAFGSKNGEAWYGGDIVPTRLQNKPAGEQTDAKIDAVSNFIGENLGISPYKINYVLDQYSGGLGDVLLPYITPETKNGAETFGEHLVAPIKDAFVVNSTDDNKYAGDFYDLKDKLEVQSNSEKATDDDKIKYKYMSEVSKKMGDLYKEKREVQADTTLGNKAKYEKVQKIQNEINSLAKEGLSTYQSANTTENYSEIGDTEFYKNAKNEWTKVNEDEQEFTAGLNTAEKDSYFKAKNKIYGITQKYSHKLKGLDKDDPSKPQIYADRKEDITKAIVNSGLDNQMKAMVYSKYYSNQDTMTNVVNAGYDVDTYITALNDIDQLRTKYSKKNGYTTEERKQKTIAYINSLNMEVPQKAMMIRNYYTSFRQYNNDIVNYVANLNISYEDKKAILEDTGMTVNGNSVSWK